MREAPSTGLRFTRRGTVMLAIALSGWVAVAGLASSPALSSRADGARAHPSLNVREPGMLVAPQRWWPMVAPHRRAA